MGDRPRHVTVVVVDGRRLVRDGADALCGEGVTVAGAAADVRGLAALCAERPVDEVIVGRTTSDRSEVTSAAGVGPRPAQVIDAASSRFNTASTHHGPHASPWTTSAHQPSRRTVLTARQHQVLTQISRGRTTAEIGTTLGIAPRTVAHHIQAVLRRLDAHCRAEAVARARRFGLLAATSGVADG